MIHIGKYAQLCVSVVTLAVMAVSPAFALWGDTGSWKKNGNVLKTRFDGLTGLDIPERFGDPISEGTGCHAYVIGVDKVHGKVCAITAQHCLLRHDKAYGDNFPEGTPIEQKLNVADDIGLIRVADELFWTYDHIKPAKSAPACQGSQSDTGGGSSWTSDLLLRTYLCASSRTNRRRVRSQSDE